MFTFDKTQSTAYITKNGAKFGYGALLDFLHAYRYFGDEKYLSRVKEAFDFYYGTYLSSSIAAGGARSRLHTSLTYITRSDA